MPELAEKQLPTKKPAQQGLTSLKGVGPALAGKLNELGIHAIEDLLFHLPFRYEDRTRLTAIGSLQVGSHAQIQGQIVGSVIQFGRRRSLLCTIRDNTGFIGLRFFHFSAAQKNALQNGLSLRCYGEVRRGKTGFEFYHPEYKIVGEDEALQVEQQLTPIYPASEGLQQTRLRKLVDQALNHINQTVELTDFMPKQVRSAMGLCSLTEAINDLHRPSINIAADYTDPELRPPAMKRLAFEELLAHRLCMRQLRYSSDQQAAVAMPAQHRFAGRFLDQLGFQLTQAQQTAFTQISHDLEQSVPMLRLLQGDVGSGKTVVASLAALQAVENGYQCAIMAPTEILAEQHLLNFQRWLQPLGITIGWLSGKTKGKQRDAQLQALANGETQLIIGTHALFQADVEFHRLALVIVDEQHRFGVHQRMALRDKGNSKLLTAHQLVMTATPIPRTLAMSAYADLDCSIIDELPPGRTPVNTAVIAAERRDEIIQRIASACSTGRQAYWVCTLIEESDALQCQAAEATATTLASQLPKLNIGLLHGRMKAKEKASIMQRFKQGEIQLLVATTVIEVGVDVPNASLMIIENSERLGLAQLHQLRGRVGRGQQASHCILLYQTPLSETGKQRLGVMKASTDGFYIAEKDLEIRGPGQLLGTQQTGMMRFRIADICRDADLLDEVKKYAELILHAYPEAVDPLIWRWLGNRVQYAQV